MSTPVHLGPLRTTSEERPRGGQPAEALEYQRLPGRDDEWADSDQKAGALPTELTGHRTVNYSIRLKRRMGSPPAQQTGSFGGDYCATAVFVNASIASSTNTTLIHRAAVRGPSSLHQCRNRCGRNLPTSRRPSSAQPSHQPRRSGSSTRRVASPTPAPRLHEIRPTGPPRASASRCTVPQDRRSRA